MHPFLHRLVAAATLAAAGVAALPAAAQAPAYPNRPVKIVVPYAPGGPTDQLTRALADKLATAFKQPFVVENKPGANAIVGAQQVANAAPDGYTLFLGSSASLAVNPLLYAKLPYDPERDFAPVSLAARAPLVMVVNSAIPARNVAELASYIKAKQGKFAYASNGNGNPLHLACELFRSALGLDMVHVPYNGTAPAIASVVAGDTQLMCDIVLSSLPQIKAGKLRAIAIAGPTKVGVLPAVPTLSQEGMSQVDATVWFAIVAPKNTPAPIVARLNQEIAKALTDTAMRERFDGLAMELASSTPQELTELTARERKKWAAVVQRNNIKLD